MEELDPEGLHCEGMEEDHERETMSENGVPEKDLASGSEEENTSGNTKSDQDSSVKSEKEYPFYENILLIGQEKCVEDWPEDSPELSPDWRPPGKLRLRRESLKVITEAENGEEDLKENSPEKNCKPIKVKRFKIPLALRRGSKGKCQDGTKGRNLCTPHRESMKCLDDFPLKNRPRPMDEELYGTEDGRRKESELTEILPGATCSHYHLSEAAEAEWLSSQMDVCRASKPEYEETPVEEREDTDSLMEWWNTVERWDELPSDEEEDLMDEEESKAFVTIADKVQKGICVFNKIFTERAESLWQHVIDLGAIADGIRSFHRKATIASITGGTTGAVGGVAAITGLALAPVTLGASLIATVVGVGVATAGGLTSASAAISDNVNNSMDRKKAEHVVQDYQVKMAEIRRCLRFVMQGLQKLQKNRRRKLSHSQDWETRRDVQMACLAGDGASRAFRKATTINTLLANLHAGMDNYFMAKDSCQPKSSKKEFTTKVREASQQLHQGLVELSSTRDKLLDYVSYMSTGLPLS